MKLNNIIIFLSLILLAGCNQTTSKNSSLLNLEPKIRYNNLGFTMIYNDNLDLKKLDDRSLLIFHKSLKKNSQVKITNPLNNKFLIANVKSNKVKFSNFYNSVITQRIAEALELNTKEPYIEITLIPKNSTFVAKKAKTFEEEKEVAQKVPIDGIKISNLSNTLKNNKRVLSNDEFSYAIKVADFYYKKTANLMIDRIKNETSIKSIKLIKLSKTNYRVLLGPFNDINSLKESFEKMNALNFENLEILNNV